MDRIVRGEVDCIGEALNDEIDTWHDHPSTTTSLWEWLGMTREEYMRWVRDPSALREIIVERKRAVEAS
jgi:hypothetical protein